MLPEYKLVATQVAVFVYLLSLMLIIVRHVHVAISNRIEHGHWVHVYGFSHALLVTVVTVLPIINTLMAIAVVRSYWEDE